MNNSAKNNLLSLAATLLILSVAGSAQAQPSAEASARAQRTFDEGMQLMREGKPADACLKFEESQRLEPAVGTQFNLADCQEKNGRFASAWTNFSAVAAASHNSGEAERERIALLRADQIVLKLTYLTVNVVEPSPGMVVKRGKTVLERADWGKAVPVDPGRIVVSAISPSKRAWTVAVELSGEGARFNIDVPPLQDAGKSLTDDGEKPRAALSSQRTWSIVSATAGVIGLGVGAVMVIAAKKHQSSAYDRSCNPENHCGSEEDADELRRAKKLGDWANVPFGLGLVGLGVGAGLWFWDLNTESKNVALAVSPSSVAIMGRF